MSSDPRMQYSEKEAVLCFHGPLMYEAKILKAEWWEGRDDIEDGPFYFVHYRGWKQKWDEWVPESRLHKMNAVGLAQQQELVSSLKDNKKKGSSPAVAKIVPDAGQKDRKRRRDSLAEKEEAYLKKPEIPLAIPDSLKSRLVEDWENITKNEMLVILPAKSTVAGFLDTFLESYRATKDTEPPMEDSMVQVIRGLKIYFDRSLGNILLYKFERHQYTALKKAHADKTMSEIYGVEHLLRLFVQLPSLIAHTNMDSDAISILRDHLTTIIQYFQKNEDSLQNEYEAASPDYLGLQRSGS